MRQKDLVVWLLIFALIMPIVILVGTETAYAFGCLNLDSSIFNVLKGLLALFFLGKFTDEDQVDDTSISSPVTSVDNSQSEQTSNQGSSPKQEDTLKEGNSNESIEVVERRNWLEEDVTSLSQEEREMLFLLNQERKNRGLTPLKVDYNLLKVARAKSQDMIDRDYFGHYAESGPFKDGPFKVIKSLNIDYYSAGENIAGAPEVDWAHRELMNSPTHRKNILKADFTHVGIGIIDGGPYGKMFTQEFADLE